MAFEKTSRQVEAIDVLNRHQHALLYGGSRSGKTVAAVRNIVVRAIRKTSRHLIVRFRYNSARKTISNDTMPWVLRNCFPGLVAAENKSDGYWTITAKDGGKSQIWLGGTDDQIRIEKLLGTEYSTIYANECSQIPFDAITLLWTRLAEDSGLPLRFYYDCNPSGKKHWTHRIFMDGVLPDGSPHDLDIDCLQLNPKHNQENLPPEYLKMLISLPKRPRQRFLDGLYLTDVEGALWSDQTMINARSKEPAELRKTVIAVDPSLSNNPRSDECGIIVCSLDVNREGVVRDDLSGKLSTRTWAQRVVNAYHSFGANEVVAEKNNGGDLVKDVIHNLDPNIRVVLVHASVGKFARAEPVSMLYEQGKVAHTKDMPELEAELTETIFKDETVKESPNRLDALVWGLTHLMIGKSGVRIHFG